eukprot:179797-Prorocentrum_minimum.AAC.3
MSCVRKELNSVNGLLKIPQRGYGAANMEYLANRPYVTYMYLVVSETKYTWATGMASLTVVLTCAIGNRLR